MKSKITDHKRIFKLTVVVAIFAILPIFLPQAETLKKRGPAATIPESSLDFAKEPKISGELEFSFPLLSIGDINLHLSYSSSNISSKTRTENQFAPSGFVGLGWNLSLGAIVGEINGNTDPKDDRYIYLGNDGSGDLKEDSLGYIYLQDYKPWKIERVINNGKIAGWKITKEDGTIFRYGNYYAAGDSFSVYRNDVYSSTRYYLGYHGVVSNLDSSLFSSAELIPYQWDLSDIQDVKGNHTTIIYKQTLATLAAPFTPSLETSLKYTRESHPYKITDSHGGEVELIQKPMTSDEFYNYPQTYMQNLFEKMYLDSIYIKRNGQIFQKIWLNYNSTDILYTGIKKRFLRSLRTLDAYNHELPDYKFDYYYSQSDANPGTMKSITDPRGGKVVYEFTTTSLSNISLSKKDSVNQINYWDPANIGLVSSDDGLAGNGFIVVNAADYVKIFKQSPKGWELDTILSNQMFIQDGFYYGLSTDLKVYNDYIIFHSNVDSHLVVAKKISNHWKTYDISNSLRQKLQELGLPEKKIGGVIGVGLNYFVIKYNLQSLTESYLWNTAVVSFTPQGLKVDTLYGTYGEFPIRRSDGVFNGTTLEAFCSDNYLVIRDVTYDEGNRNKFSHFKYSPLIQKWETVIYHHYPDFYWDWNPNMGVHVYITKNFILYNKMEGSGSRIAVYRHTGDNLTLIEEFTYGTSAPSRLPIVTAGDEYYAYCNEEYGKIKICVKTWDGKGFTSTNIGSSYPIVGQGFDFPSLSTLNNRLLLSWNDIRSYDPIINSRKLAYIEYSPETRQWSPLTLIDSMFFKGIAFENVPLSSYLGAYYSSITYLYGKSPAVGVTGNMFIVNWYPEYFDNGLQKTAYLKAYQFHGNTVTNTLIDSLGIRWDVQYPDNPENANNWILQPSSNFITLSRPGKQESSSLPPDTMYTYQLSESPSGSMQFTGNPTVAVLNKQIVYSGMGDNTMYYYTYENGSYNERQSVQYNKITETLPCSNGKTVTYYYNDLGPNECDTFINVANYKELDGSPYKTLIYNSNNSVVSQKVNTWNAYEIDTLLGIYHRRLVQSSVTTDGVTKSTSYTYDDDPYFQMRTISETNSDGKVRMTKMKYPQDYSFIPNAVDPFVQAIDSMQTSRHIINAVIEKTTWDNYEMNVVSSEVNKYKLFNNSQILPAEKWSLRSANPLSYLNWQESYTTSNSLVINGSYYKQQSFDSYDSYGNLLQTTNANGNPTASKWGHNYSRPVALVKNANSNECGYNSMEDGWDWEGWTSGGSSISSDLVYKGWYSAYSSNNYGPTKNFFVQNGISKTKTYKLEAWIYRVSGTATIAIERRDGSGNLIRNNIAATFSSGTGWQHVSISIPPDSLAFLPDNGYLRVWCGFPNGTGNVGYVDDIRFYPVSSEITTTTYDPITLLPNSISDANNMPTFYNFDFHQRLQQTLNYLGNTLKYYSYYYSCDYNNDTLNPADPNYVETKSYRTDTDYSDEKAFTDGLGRNIQNQAISDNGKTIVTTAATYDALGRVDKTYKPFERVLSGYDPSYSLHDSTYYNAEMGDYRYNTGQIVSSLYNQNLYFADPLGRVSHAGFPGSTWKVNAGHDKRFTYANATGNLYKTSVTDEQNIVTETYKDIFGRTTKTIQDAGTGKLNLTTNFTYDILDNLKTSIDPSGKQTSSSYNTLNQLTSKTSPDAGTIEYLYDKNGNLRLKRDANHLGSSVNNVNLVRFASSGTLTGNFTLNGLGKVNFSLNVSGPIIGSGSIILQVKGPSNVVLYFLTANSSNSFPTGSFVLPKGTYSYSIQITSRDQEGMTFVATNFIQCQMNYDFVYYKYDGQNRVTEEGEYETGSLSNFTQTNADDPSFPPSGNCQPVKKYYYDLPSSNPLAAGQRNLQGKLSYVEKYTYATPVFQLTILTMKWGE